MDEERSTRRHWRRPALLSLSRSRPEETVMVACKMWPNVTMGPQTSDIRCGTLPGCPYVGCTTIAIS